MPPPAPMHTNSKTGNSKISEYVRAALDTLSPTLREGLCSGESAAKWERQEQRCACQLDERLRIEASEQDDEARDAEGSFLSGAHEHDGGVGARPQPSVNDHPEIIIQRGHNVCGG